MILKRIDMNSLKKYYIYVTPFLIAGISHFLLGYRGLTAETVHVEISLNSGGLNRFLYPYDSSRRLMQLPYGLSILIDENSYRGFVITFFVIASLNILLFSLILKRILHLTTKNVLLSQIIFGFYSADMTNNFLQMFVVKISILFLLLSISIYISEKMTISKLFLIIMFQTISILVYELIIVTLIFASLLIFLKQTTRKKTKIFFFLIPSILGGLQLIKRYLINNETSYQLSQVNIENPLKIVASYFNLFSYVFNYPSWILNWLIHAKTDQHIEQMFNYKIIHFLLFLISSIIFIFFAFNIRTKIIFITFLFLHTLISILPYAFVPNSIHPDLLGPWRSLLITSLSASFLIFIFIYMADVKKYLKKVLVITYIGFSLSASLLSQNYLLKEWKHYLTFSNELYAVLPNPKEASLVVMFDKSAETEMYKRNSLFVLNSSNIVDIFSSNIWFNSTMQLLYPDKTIVGIYFDNDGNLARDVKIVTKKDSIEITESNVGVSKSFFKCDEIYLLEYSKISGQILPSESIPENLSSFSCSTYLKVNKDQHNFKDQISSPLLGELIKLNTR